MSLLDATELAIRLVDTVWSVADDFAPSLTLRELFSGVTDLREALFDTEANEQEVLLRARVSALQRAHSLASAAPVEGAAAVANAETMSRMENRLELLKSLLDTGPRERDVFGGTLGDPGVVPSSVFQRLGDQPTAAGVLGQRLQRRVQRTLGTQRAQDAMVERRARLEERARVLNQLSAVMSRATTATGAEAAELPRQVGARLDAEMEAISFVVRALQGTQRQGAGPQPSTAAEGPRAGGQPLSQPAPRKSQERKRRIPIE